MLKARLVLRNTLNASGIFDWLLKASIKAKDWANKFQNWRPNKPKLLEK